MTGAYPSQAAMPAPVSDLAEKLRMALESKQNK